MREKWPERPPNGRSPCSPDQEHATGTATAPSREAVRTAGGKLMTTSRGNRLAGLVLVSLCSTVPTPGWASAPVIVIGPATVVDGNHLEVRGTKVRLWGIEAPGDSWCREPPDEGCAAKAKKTLEQIIEGHQVWCRQVLIDGDPQFVGDVPGTRCQLVSRRRMPNEMWKMSRYWINWLMVKRGWAVGYSWLKGMNPVTTAIAEESRKARKRKRGMWRHNLEIPDDAMVRRENPNWVVGTGESPIAGVPTVTAGDTIRIKGRRVRLAGIVAIKDRWCPEGSPRCSSEGARRELEKVIAGRGVRCIPEEMPGPTPEPEGTQAFCTAKKSGPCDEAKCWLGWQMVKSGHAIARRDWADRHPAMNALIRTESQAIAAGRGMWQERVRIEPREGAAAPFHAPGGLRVVGGASHVMSAESLWFENEVYLYGIHGARDKWCRSSANRGCGEEAKNALRKMVVGQEIVCVWPEEARFEKNRPLRGLCTNEAQRKLQEQGRCEGIECTMNYELVRRGWAVQINYARRRDNDRVMHELIQAERLARSERAGIWAGRVRLAAYVRDMRAGTKR